MSKQDHPDRKANPIVAGHPHYVLPWPSDVIDGVDCMGAIECHAVLQACAGIVREHQIAGLGFAGDDEKPLVLDEALQLASSKLDTSEDGYVQPKSAIFDAVFGVRRSDETNLAFATAIGQGLLNSVRELKKANTLSISEQSMLVSGFRDLLYYMDPKSSLGDLFVQKSFSLSGEKPSYEPFERWRDGHCTFMSICSALNYVAAEALEAGEANDWEAIDRPLAVTNSLLHASASAFRLTGDVTPVEYASIVTRMTPPNAPEGFSGLWMIDHQSLLRQVKRIGELLDTAPPALMITRARFRDALNASYAAHRYVCELAAGERASLAGEKVMTDDVASSSLVSFGARALRMAKAPIS